MPLNQQGKKGITVLERVIDPDYYREIGLLLHSGGKKDCVWSAEGASSGSMMKINGKLQQPNPGRMAEGTDPSGMKVRVTPPEKEPRPAEVLAKGGGNTEWVVEGGSYEYQLRPHDQLQK